MYSNNVNIPDFLLPVAHVILGLAMLMTFWRIWRGPTMADRIVALDLLAAIIMGLFALRVVSSGFMSFLDLSAAIAVISFLATVAFARYLEIKLDRS